MFRFEIRVLVDMGTSLRFRAFVKDLFPSGRNASFQLVDVLEAAQALGPSEDKQKILAEIDSLTKEKGGRVWLKREEWVS